jgi:hypothetical protein
VDHSIMRVKTDFKMFRDRRKKSGKEQGARTYGTDAEILAVLPERSIVDVQAALYFQTMETTYRILHEPSFWAEYHQFWEQQSNDKERIGFAVMLVLTVAITKCLTPKDDVFIGDTTADRQNASNLIDVCESWISQQPRKRITLAFFQLHCLMLLAKRVNCVKLKQDWVTSGDLLRLSLASGMHRDPALLGDGRISDFDKEMKKRLWITVMELELQSSVESGLQSGLTALYFDTPAPSNIPDDAFTKEVQQMPTNHSSEHFTSTSYLVASLKSLPLRIHLTQLLNTPTSDLQYSDVLHYDAQIHAAVSSLPHWDDDRAAIPSALLQLQLRQYLLILHKPYAKLASTNDRFMYSFTTCVDACNSMITTHDTLISKSILFLSNFRNDVVRVGLTLSQVVYENCTRHAVKSSLPMPTHETHFAADPGSHFADSMKQRWGPQDATVYLASIPKESFLVKTLCSSSIELLEHTRQLFEQKVFRLGTGYMEYWLMAVAVGMLPPPPSPATSIAYINNANDDILSRCRKTLDCFTQLAFRVLALQRDPENSLASSLRNTMASVSPRESRVGTPGMMLGVSPMMQSSGFTPMNGGAGGMGGEKGPVAGGPFDALQDLGADMSGWSFPDFWAFDLGGDF